MARYIHEDCSQLQLAGLMTIGKYDETADRFFEVRNIGCLVGCLVR